MLTFTVQGVRYALDADSDTPRLWRLVEVATFGPGWSEAAVLAEAQVDAERGGRQPVTISPEASRPAAIPAGPSTSATAEPGLVARKAVVN